MFPENRDRVLAAERRPAGEHLVQHDAGGVKVRTLIRLFSARLLRGHVFRRAEDRPGDRQGLAFRAPRQAEVHQHHAAAPVQHDVARLHVAMDDPNAMDRLYPLKELGEHGQGLVRREAAPSLDDLLQRHSVHQFHRIEAGRSLLADGVDSDEVRMFHVAQGARLLLETAPIRLVQRQLRREDLNGHLAVERGIVRAVHGGHAARANRFDETIPTEFAPRTNHLTLDFGLRISGGVSASKLFSRA